MKMEFNTIKLLLIDDDEDEFYIIQHLLQDAKEAVYTIKWFSNYNDGLLAILSQQYDVALIDYRLGGSDGISLIAEAVEKGCEMPLVLLTGQGNTKIDMASMEAGADAYLVKDEFNIELFEPTIRYALNHKYSENRLKETKEYHKKIAEYDVTTSLGNRNLFNSALVSALKNIKHKNELVALLFLDLDKFKQVNDSLGHEMGDSLLQQVALRFKKAVRETDKIFRFGGDEFVMILEGNFNVQRLSKIAQNIIDDLSEPFHLNGKPIFVSVSIGIATSSNCKDDPTVLIKSSDSAMYLAKKKGGGKYQFAMPEQNRIRPSLSD